jgi:hypothetical protein
MGGVVDVLQIDSDNRSALTTHTDWSVTDNYGPNLKVQEMVECHSELYRQYLIYPNII